MSTTHIKGKEYTLIEEEGGEIRLVPVESEKREPRPGDVWEDERDSIMLVRGGKNVILEPSLGRMGTLEHEDVELSGYTYLGKFSNVYVKISDIVAALSHKDLDGEDVIDWINSHKRGKSYGRDSSLEDLRKLNIIKD